MFCSQCGSQIPDWSPFCRDCGAPVEGDRARTSLGGPEGEVYPLLAQANLLRIRRQWEKAVAKCIEVLRRYPNNVSAHSLLGDIYRDQDRPRDALEWYKLTVELDPGSRVDRDKLDAMIDRVYAGGKPKPEATQPGQEPHLAKAKAAWTETFRQANLAKPICIGMLVTLGTLLAALLVALLYRTLSSPAAISVDTRIQSRAAPTTGQPAPAVRGVPGAEVPPTDSRSTQELTGEARSQYGKLEQELLSHLSVNLSRITQAAKVHKVEIDPRTQAAEIGVTLAATQGLVETKRGIIATTIRLALLALEWSHDLSGFKFRVYLPAVDEAGRSSWELAFVGGVPAARLRAAEVASMGCDKLLRLFDHPWWRDDLKGIRI